MTRFLRWARMLTNLRVPRPTEIPYFIEVLRDDRTGALPGTVSPLEHLNATVDWIVNAAEAVSRKGVSAGFSLRFGWGAAYLETTGYIIPTLYQVARLCDRADARDLATSLAEWALTQQRPNGGFPGGVGQTEPPLVFDTGQVLFGLIEAYRETRRAEFISAADRAGRFLVEGLDNDGCFAKNLWLDSVHTFDVRVSWALLLLAEESGEAMYRRAAERNIEWALRQQLDNGLFAYDGFVTGGPIFTHALGYTLQGLIECAEILERDDIFKRVDRTLSVLLDDINRNGRPAGAYDLSWQGNRRWSCLTGDCQLAIVFGRAAHRSAYESDCRKALTRVLDQVKKTHRTQFGHPGVRGGIKGSHPIWGLYQPYNFPNWAAKFFLDALLFDIYGAAPTRG